MTQHQTDVALARHKARRERDLIEVANWPRGVAPFAGLTANQLNALKSRGLVEVRYHLTPDGEREVTRLMAQATKPL